MADWDRPHVGYRFFRRATIGIRTESLANTNHIRKGQARHTTEFLKAKPEWKQRAKLRMGFIIERLQNRVHELKEGVRTYASAEMPSESEYGCVEPKDMAAPPAVAPPTNDVGYTTPKKGRSAEPPTCDRSSVGPGLHRADRRGR